MDGLRGGLARAHGEDDRGRAGDGVAAGVDVFKARRAVFIDDDAAPLLRFQPGGGVADQGVGRVADGDDHGIDVEIELAALLDHGAAAAGGVRLAQFHLHAGHGAHIAVFVAVDGGGVGEHAEVDALFLSVMHLLEARGHLLLRAAVDDGDLVRAQPQRRARRVHGHVAAADHGHLLAHAHGGVGLREGVGLHEVDAGQKFVGRVHAVEVLAGDALKARKPRAGADEHSVVALVEQFVQGDRAADHGVCLDLHAQRLDGGDLLAHQALGQAEFGDAVDQHAAGGVQRLVDGYIVTQLGEVARAGQARGAGADHGHATAVLLGGLRRGAALCHGVVRAEALEAADAHRVALYAAHAFGLALRLLRADAAADGGQVVGQADDVVGLVELALLDVGDELGDVHAHRAAGHARRVFAADAARGLLAGHGLVVALRDLLEVAAARLGRLLAGGQLGQALIVHARRPPSCGRYASPCCAFPRRSTCVSASWPRRNRPDGRRTPGRPRRRTSSRRPR